MKKPVNSTDHKELDNDNQLDSSDDLDSTNLEPFSLPPISSEQKTAVELIQSHNIQIDAVAGSGKTTTSLYIAKFNRDVRILLLTYNKRLKFETRAKAHQLKITNLSVHTYHSFFYQFFEGHCHEDSVMGRIIRERFHPKKQINYSIVIVDETQDMTPLYFEAVLMLLSYNCAKSFQMCLLGDIQQCIYVYNHSDSRFLTFAPEFFKYFPQNSFSWEKSTLKISYRCSSGITDFVNNCMLKSSRLEASKKGARPKYIICDCFAEETEDNESQILPYLFSILETGVSYTDIFILAPSVRNTKTISRKLANSITKYNITAPKEKIIPIYVPVDDEEHTEEEILKGKLCFLTFHQAKGLERKIVFVLNFDRGYFEFYNRNVDFELCPNELYVAVTRASEQLFLFHHHKNEYLPFLAREKIPEFCEIHGGLIEEKKNNSNFDKTRRYSVIDLIRHLPYDIVEEACSYFTVSLLSEEDNKIPLTGKVAEGELFELVNDINGTAIPAWLELKLNHKITILEHLLCEDLVLLLQRPSQLSIKQKKFLKKMAKKSKSLSIPDVLHIANIYNSVLSGYDYKLEQITAYDWFQNSSMNLAVNRLKTRLTNNCTFEFLVETDLFIPELNGTFTIVGSVDAIHNLDVYEFKCTEQLSNEHLLQLAIYMYLYKVTQNRSEDYQFILWNILTNEKRSIHASFEYLEKLVHFLIRKKNSLSETFSDQHFIQENMQIVQKYIKPIKQEKDNAKSPRIETEKKNCQKSKITMKSDQKEQGEKINYVYEGKITYADFLLKKMIEIKFWSQTDEKASLNKIIWDLIENCPIPWISAEIKENINRATKIGRKFSITSVEARQWKLLFCEIYGELKSKIESKNSSSTVFFMKLIKICENIIKLSLNN